MKINKNVIILIWCITMSILMTSFISAYEEGQTVTQQQLDNLDVNTLTINNLECRYDGYRYESRRNAYILWSCLDINPNGNGYIIVREQKATRINPVALRQCASENGIEYCKALVRQKIREKVFDNFENLKQKIRDYQTDTQLDNWVREVLENYNPFG